MKYLFALLFLVGCSACSKPSPELYFQGAGATFSQARSKAFLGHQSIENSFVRVGSEVVAVHDPYFDGSLYVTELGPTGLEFKNNRKVGDDARFTYVMEHGGSYYNFVLRSGGIYLLKSADLESWTLINGGRPVLSSTAGTIYQHVWNVGVTVDDLGTWHLLVECADGSGPQAEQWGVGLAYSTAVMVGDNIDFDVNRSASHVIAKGGNPDLKFIPGKGILAVHGSLEDGIWKVRASTFDGATWTRNESFAIGSWGVQVCDPSLVELANGETLLSVSVDQNSIYLAKSKDSLDEIFDRVKP